MVVYCNSLVFQLVKLDPINRISGHLMMINIKITMRKHTVDIHQFNTLPLISMTTECMTMRHRFVGYQSGYGLAIGRSAGNQMVMD